MCRIAFFLSLLACVSAVLAQPSVKVEYAAADSLEVTAWLADSTLRSPLDFARRLEGRPYVAHTLERGAEHLVVNLRELDCATLVETASALSIARSRLERAERTLPYALPWASPQSALAPAVPDAWALFCEALESLRYRDGRCTDYLSRLHYLTFWIDDHLRRRDVEEVVVGEKWMKRRTTDIHFMSTHPDKYAGLKNPDDVRRMAALEAQYAGQSFRYIPQEYCGLSKEQLGAVRDGDIVCIVTTLAGLDYSHQGIAFWGQDGKLHLLHASSARRCVVADARPLDVYLQGIRSSIGVRIFRLRSPTWSVLHRPFGRRNAPNGVGRSAVAECLRAKTITFSARLS